MSRRQLDLLNHITDVTIHAGSTWSDNVHGVVQLLERYGRPVDGVQGECDALKAEITLPCYFDYLWTQSENIGRDEVRVVPDIQSASVDWELRNQTAMITAKLRIDITAESIS